MESVQLNHQYLFTNKHSTTQTFSYLYTVEKGLLFQLHMSEMKYCIQTNCLRVPMLPQTMYNHIYVPALALGVTGL